MTFSSLRPNEFSVARVALPITLSGGALLEVHRPRPALPYVEDGAATVSAQNGATKSFGISTGPDPKAVANDPDKELNKMRIGWSVNVDLWKSLLGNQPSLGASASRFGANSPTSLANQACET